MWLWSGSSPQQSTPERAILSFVPQKHIHCYPHLVRNRWRLGQVIDAWILPLIFVRPLNSSLFPWDSHEIYSLQPSHLWSEQKGLKDSTSHFLCLAWVCRDHWERILRFLIGSSSRTSWFWCLLTSANLILGCIWFSSSLVLWWPLPA